MPAGFTDYMRMAMGWWSAPPGVPAVGGPYCVVAVQSYVAGAVAVDGYAPGAAAVDSYAAGAVAVQGGCL